MLPPRSHRPSRWAPWALVAAGSLGATALAQPPPAKAPAETADVTAPQVIEHVDAVYPPSRLAQVVEANVVLTVTIEKDGRVGEVTVAESGGGDFDEAAISAVNRWRFTPALRHGVPIRARITIPFHFAPEPHKPEPKPDPKPDKPAPPKKPEPPPEPPTKLPAGTGLPHSHAEAGKPIEIHVQGRPIPPRRGTSDFRLDARMIHATSHNFSAADLLNSAPGVQVTHPEGDVVAQRVFLRGFDAEHGQDIEFSVGAIPMNQMSHLHGQGYADLNLIIPETVRSIRVIEGVYDPSQGDFAVAGSVDYDLGVPERGMRFKGTLGSFGTKRLLALWAPEGQAEETFAAGVLRQSNGFGNGTRGGVSGGVTGQYRFELPGDLSGLVHIASYGGRQAIAGVLRRDDLEAGRVGFHDAYSDPSARAQSAAATRSQIGLSLERAANDGSFATASIWFAYSTYRSRLNFTGYSQRSRENPDFVGRGDLVEQANQDLGFGGRLAYRTRKIEPWKWLSAQLALGADARTSRIDQQQALLAAPQNETWDRRVDATVQATSVGMYGDLSLGITEYVRLRGGMRANLAVFDVDDRLGNFIPAFQLKTHIPGFRRTAAGIAFGPRAVLEVQPLPWLQLSAAYGEGFRSPQARQLEEGENAPFAKVRSFEAGVKLTDRSRVSFTAAMYQTNLSYDSVFDAVEARLERIGPTTRRGFVAYFQAMPIDGFTSGVSATFVHATLDAPPPPTPDNPTPPYVTGQQLPYVPPMVVRADVGYRRTLGSILKKPVEGRVGYGVTYMSPRPLPYASSSPPVFLADASLAVRRDFLEVGVDATNLFNAKFAQTEYTFVSNWQTQSIPSYLPMRHVAAGPPLSVLASVTLHL